MKAATLFSGIGTPECAMPNWDWQWCAEIEPFPSKVLAQRFGMPNLGDVTASDFIDRARAISPTLDVLVFGSPCQGFSVAGKRLELDDPRSNLALHALRICRELAPTWIVFENVPGLLSSWSGAPTGPGRMDFGWRTSLVREFGESSDFAEFLQCVSDIGYFGAWTVLDAQYRGVAQRRERVFFVGCLGDWRSPAVVLLEPESVSGYPPARRETRESATHATAPSLTSSGRGVERTGDSRGQDAVIAMTLNAKGGSGRNDGESETFVCSGQGYWGESESAATLGTEARALYESTLVAHALTGEGFGASDSSHPAVAFNLRGREGGSQAEMSDVASLRAASGGSSRSYVADCAVRRITVAECARLQSFPDTWTHIKTKPRKVTADTAAYLAGHGIEVFEKKGKRYACCPADGPMYRAYGNSMCVNVIRWITDAHRTGP